MKGVTLTPLRQIPTAGGSVMHALRTTDAGYAGFGEAYFSTVEKGYIKGWKRHRRMVMNLVVPVGRVRFVCHDEDATGETHASFDLAGSAHDYARLTVEPGLWMAFMGLDKAVSVVLNLASILHDPSESDTRAVEPSAWRWSD